VADRTLTILGGVAIDSTYLARLAPANNVTIGLAEPGTSPDGAVAARFPVLAETSEPDTVAFVVRTSDAPFQALRRDIDTAFFAALVGSILLAVFLAAWIASRLSRPIDELARLSGRIDLDRLDLDFETDRADEIGSLSRMLGALQRRLRASASRLRDAERRAAVGEIARQVNHDVRNGLTPIRNVVEHLSELARDDPAAMPDVFRERQGTLHASITYLHELAASYARLSPRLDRRPCDVNDVVRTVARGAAGPGGGEVRVIESLAPGLPAVLADPVALRRVVENLVANAIEALDGKGGVVRVATAPADGSNGRVRVTITDTGRGMSEDELKRVFDHFYSTKPDGTGLGLSIVRRLAGDLGGTIDVASEPGRGTVFTLDLPAAGSGSAQDRAPRVGAHT
jgi:signal transduction histidine kinase